MSNNIDLTGCDAFELTEIAHETLSAAAGYFYQMFLMEQNQKYPDGLLLQNYREEHSQVINEMTNSNHALLKDKLVNQINQYSVYSLKLKEMAF